MTLRATGALAPVFTHTQDASYDFRVVPTDTANSDDATIATGNFRMCLAPTTGSVTDFLRATESAVNAALIADASTAVRLALTLSAAGVVTLTFSGPVDSVDIAGPVWRRLGLASASPALVGNTVIVGVRPVWFLAILSAVEHGVWLPRQCGGTGRTTSGRWYAVAASLTSYQRDHDIGYQPTDPTFRTSLGCEASPLHAAPAYMYAIGSVATAREWSVLDVLQAARNGECALAIGNWRQLLTSTTETYWTGYVDGDTLLSPDLNALDRSWPAYASWKLGFSLPTTGSSGTRA